MKFTSVILAFAGVTALEHRHHHKHHKQADAYRMEKSKLSRRDAYDQDPTTASPYDDMYQHKKFDWGVEEG